MSDREFSNDDLSLPKATVKKIVTEILGPSSGVTLDKHAYDLLIECCVEFVTMISSQANEIAEGETKKTIATEHIEKALRDLGFPEYVPPVLAAAGEQKDALKVREKRINKIDHSGLSTEELIAMQQKLLEESAQKFQADQAALAHQQGSSVKDESKSETDVKSEGD